MAIMKAAMNCEVPSNVGNFLTSLETISLLIKPLLYDVCYSNICIAVMYERKF